MLTAIPFALYESPDPAKAPVLNVGNADCPFWERGTPGGVNSDIISTGYEDIRLDATALPFRDRSIRAVYAHHILEHIYREQALATVVEWARVLIPGGILSVVIPDWRHLFSMVELGDYVMRDKFLFGHDDSRGPYQPHRSAWSADEVAQTLRAAGLRDVTQHDPTTYQPLVARPRWQGCVRGVK